MSDVVVGPRAVIPTERSASTSLDEAAPPEGQLARNTEGRVSWRNPEESRLARYELSSIRGIQEDRRLKLKDVLIAVNDVLKGASLSNDASKMISQIWVKARMDPSRDQGKDIKALLPLLEAHPELLESLYKIATTDTLFEQERTNNEQLFDKMRSEFLAELISGAVDSRNITQGPGSMCTAASMLKALPPEELLRLGAGFALDGSVVTKGGDTMELREPFFGRAQRDSNAALEDIKCRRPSAGMLMLLDGVIELGVPDTTVQSGSYWFQYADAWRDLRGNDSACAGRDAKIAVDPATGQAVANGAPGAVELSQMEYLTQKLKSNPVDGKLKSNPADGTSGGVLIDTVWSHASRLTANDQQHGRHMLRAVGVETRNGAEYIVCENPIGDFINRTRSADGHAEYCPPGTILGNQNGFWFEQGEKGVVYIRKDVLAENLQTVMVDYNDSYHVSEGIKVASLGTLDSSVDVPPIDFVVADPEPLSPSSTVAVASSVSKEAPRRVNMEPLTKVAKAVASQANELKASGPVVGRRKREEEELMLDPAVAQPVAAKKGGEGASTETPSSVTPDAASVKAA